LDVIAREASCWRQVREELTDISSADCSYFVAKVKRVYTLSLWGWDALGELMTVDVQGVKAANLLE
jgi:hypothetical protein